MKVSVLLFASAREIAGQDSVELNLSDGATVAIAKAALLKLHPTLTVRAGSLLWAINNEFAAENCVIHGTDVIACFPPVSGG